MKTKFLIVLSFIICHLSFSPIGALAQPAGGFGGFQKQMKLETSQEWKDVNYVGDDQAYHTCDIYLPKKEAASYPVVIHIYGSAWFSNNGKGMADLGTIGKALLDAGYAVVCPNHRSSIPAVFLLVVTWLLLLPPPVVTVMPRWVLWILSWKARLATISRRAVLSMLPATGLVQLTSPLWTVVST